MTSVVFRYDHVPRSYFDPMRCRDTCTGEFIGLLDAGRHCVCLGDYFEESSYKSGHGCGHCEAPKGCFRTTTQFPCTAAHEQGERHNGPANLPLMIRLHEAHDMSHEVEA